MSVIRVKEGVQPRLIHLVAAVSNVASALVPPLDELWITAGIDGEHGRDSLHYALRALDVRTHNLSADQRNQLKAGLKTALGSSVDVIVEAIGQPNEHLHIEWDPH